MILALLLAQAATPCVPDTALPAPLAGWTERGASLDEGKAVTMAAVDPAAVRLVGVPRPKEGGRVFGMRFVVRQAGLTASRSTRKAGSTSTPRRRQVVRATARSSPPRTSTARAARRSARSCGIACRRAPTSWW